METTVRDVMETKVFTVAPAMKLSDLFGAFLEKKVSGFPVIQDGKLVGLVARSDVVRQLSVERSLAEFASSSAGGGEAASQDASAILKDIEDRVGKRIAELRVKDLMIHDLITFTPDQSVREVARAFVTRRIHRAPVVEGGKLVGIVTSLDLVELLA
jgi:CBS domain-containing protein